MLKQVEILVKAQTEQHCAGNNWHPIFNIDSLNVAKTNMMESVPGTKAHNDWSDTYKKQKSKTE